MNNPDQSFEPQTINLTRGGQAVINGAIVTASAACTIEVGSGAFVVTGRSLWRERDPQRNPREELYFSVIDASTDPVRFADERFRLFTLLSQVVAQCRTHEGQKECALCAAALIAGNCEDATRSAARLASERFEDQAGAKPSTPGQMGERRARAQLRPANQDENT